jgi:hypothetical protein
MALSSEYSLRRGAPLRNFRVPSCGSLRACTRHAPAALGGGTGAGTANKFRLAENGATRLLLAGAPFDTVRYSVIPRYSVSLLRTVLICALAACAGDGTGPITNDINGDWLIIERVEAPTAEVLCDNTAQVHVTQTSASFSATGYQSGSCVVGTDWIDNSGEVTVQNGRIGRGASITFRFAGCQYAGAIAAGDATASGTVRCTAGLPGGALVGTGTWQMRRADFNPPTVTVATANPSLVSHGDTLEVTVQASDDLALAYVGTSVTYDPSVLTSECPAHLPSDRDSVAVSGTTAQRTTRHVVPACTEYITITGIATDTAGNRTDATAYAGYIALPVSQVSGVVDDSVYTLGDSVQISVTATNARGLGYVGYRWYNPDFAGQDSVAVTGTAVTRSFELPIPADRPATQLRVRVFARHRLGFLTTADLPPARSTDAVQFPVLRLPLPGTPNDMAYVAGTDRLYLTDPAAAVVREVGLAPFALGATHAIGAAGASLDLSASGDSLVVALKGQLALAVLRLSTGSAITVPITPPDAINLYDTRRIRVMANGLAMIGVGSGSGGHVVALDLADAVQSVRIPWYGYGTFQRARDRSRLLFIDPTTPVGSQLYEAATDSFQPHESGRVTKFGSQAQISGDDAATMWLVRCELLTAAMIPVRILTDPSVDFGPSALATDGTRAYCARGDGFVEFDVATGERVRAVWLPERPDYLLALPGNRVLAARGATLYLVTLP